jgi:hypothetical protein
MSTEEEMTETQENESHAERLVKLLTDERRGIETLTTWLPRMRIDLDEVEEIEQAILEVHAAVDRMDDALAGIQHDLYQRHEEARQDGDA